MHSFLVPSFRRLSAGTILGCQAVLNTTTRCSHNAYNQFVKSKYLETKEKFPKLKNSEILKKLSENYRQLTSEQKDKLKLLGLSVSEAAEAAATDKRKKLLFAYRGGMPRRPASSGLNVFIREKFSDSKGISLAKGASNFREAIQEWNSMSLEDRSKYSIKAQELKDAYEKSLHEWATKNEIKFSKIVSVLASRFYDKSNRLKSDHQLKTSIKHEATSEHSKSPKKDSISPSINSASSP